MSTPQDIPSLKPMHLQTDLVHNGQPVCSILSPDDRAHRRVAEDLSQGIRQLSGVSIPVTTRGIPDRRNVIALGQMMTNPLLERLYWNCFPRARPPWERWPESSAPAPALCNAG